MVTMRYQHRERGMIEERMSGKVCTESLSVCSVFKTHMQKLSPLDLFFSKNKNGNRQLAHTANIIIQQLTIRLSCS